MNVQCQVKKRILIFKPRDWDFLGEIMVNKNPNYENIK